MLESSSNTCKSLDKGHFTTVKKAPAPCSRPQARVETEREAYKTNPPLLACGLGRGAFGGLKSIALHSRSTFRKGLANAYLQAEFIF